MPSPHDEPTPSRIAILKHPLHPMAVVFPTAFLMATPVSDVVFWIRGDAFWAQVSFWLATAGFVMGVVAAILGFAEFLLVKGVRDRLAGWTHMIVALMALALAAGNVQLRLHDPVAAVIPWGILLSGVMAAIVGVAGWIGGTLTFGHGIGTFVHRHDEAREDGDEKPPSP